MAAATLSVGVLLAILEAAPEIRVQFRVDSHHSSKLGGKSQGGRRDRNQPCASLWIAPLPEGRVRVAALWHRNCMAHGGDCICQIISFFGMRFRLGFEFTGRIAVHVNTAATLTCGLVKDAPPMRLIGSQRTHTRKPPK